MIPSLVETGQQGAFVEMFLFRQAFSGLYSHSAAGMKAFYEQLGKHFFYESASQGNTMCIKLCVSYGPAR